MSTTLLSKTDIQKSAFSYLKARATPRIPLTHRQFAEKYITLPESGPYGGSKFRIDRQPFTGLLFDAMDDPYWKTVVVTGPVQASKTLCGFVVPTLRDIVELRLDPIIGVPEADMASDKWDIDFVPVLEASPELRWLLPSKGPGSKGGRIKDRVTLGNGVNVKIMTRGGKATNKAGYTSPRVRITEAAGFSDGAEKDQEADAYRQIVGRMGAFRRNDPRRSLIIEGTITVAAQLPWRARGSDDDEALISSRSRIVSPCPHCGSWISPQREHLVGWQDAESEQEAADQACFLCPECGQAIDDEQRRISMADCRLLHFGQEMTADGTVIGPMPPVTTLWFAWKAWENLLKDAADTAVAEWKAAQIEEGTLDRENAERDLCQKWHAKPYQSSLADNEPLSPQVVRKRRDGWPRGILPPDTMFVTVGRDIGQWTGWWLALAFRECGLIHVPAYGAFDICRDRSDELSTRILAALAENDELLQEGFQFDGSSRKLVPRRVWTDINFMPDDVCAAMRAAGSGLKARFQCTRGRGKSVPGNNGGYNHPKRVTTHTPLIGMQWFREWNYKRRVPETTFNSDFWTLYMQERLRTKPGKKGALAFFRADTKNEHAKLSNHLCSDQLKKKFDSKKGGLVEKWTQSGENHWGDCCKNALAAGNECGFSLRDIVEAPADEAKAWSLDEYDNWYAEMLK